MNINMPNDPQFNEYYQKHLKCLKLGGLQPKTIEAYSRAIRRIGNYFDCRINNLRPISCLTISTNSWSLIPGARSNLICTA
jgi:hypothetical protein